MGGFLFRLGVGIKNGGENWKCDWLIRLGLFIKDVVLKHGKLK